MRPEQPRVVQHHSMNEKTNAEALLHDLQRELGRLEVERAQAISKRDHVFSVVEAGDDSGFALSLALNELKAIEDRIEQVKGLVFQQRKRIAASRPGDKS